METLITARLMQLLILMWNIELVNHQPFINNTILLFFNSVMITVGHIGLFEKVIANVVRNQ